MRKLQIGAAGFLLLTIAAFFLLFRLLHQPAFLNPPQSGSVHVLFSDGHVEFYPTSRLDEFKWIAIKAQTYNPSLAKQITLTAARFAGLRKYSVPDPPILAPLEAHLRACGQYTRQSFFIHQGFADYLGQLNFSFGGSENARTPAEWVEANLHSIRTNRVLVGPAGSQRFVSCAVLVTEDSIRIIPESALLHPSGNRSASDIITD